MYGLTIGREIVLLVGGWVLFGIGWASDAEAVSALCWIDGGSFFLSSLSCGVAY